MVAPSAVVTLPVVVVDWRILPSRPRMNGSGVFVWLFWSIFYNSGLFWGLIPPAIAFIGWYWPSRKETDRQLALERRP